MVQMGNIKKKKAVITTKGERKIIEEPKPEIKPKEEKIVKQQEQPAVAGEKPSFKTTAQGDIFDVTKPINRKDFSSFESFQRALGFKQSIKGRSERFEERRTGRKEAEAAAVAERAGAAGLTEELTGKIEERPSLLEVPNEKIAAFLDDAGIPSTGTDEKGVSFEIPLNERIAMAQQAGVNLNKIAGVAAGAIGGIAGRTAAEALKGEKIAAQFSKGNRAFEKLTKNMGVVKTGIGAVGGFAIYKTIGSIFDINGPELANVRDVIRGLPGQMASTVETASQGNPDVTPEQALRELVNTNNQINQYENRIREIGATNIKFLYSKEYLDIQEEIAAVRIELRESIIKIQGVAAAGIS